MDFQPNFAQRQRSAITHQGFHWGRSLLSTIASFVCYISYAIILGEQNVYNYPCRRLRVNIFPFVCVPETRENVQKEFRKHFLLFVWPYRPTQPIVKNSLLLVLSTMRITYRPSPMEVAWQLANTAVVYSRLCPPVRNPWSVSYTHLTLPTILRV